MLKTYKILSALLSYPTAELQEAAPTFPALLLREGIVPQSAMKELLPLIQDVAERDLLDLQSRYVLLFDRTRSLSLHLFEHVHGESRDRGQAMVDLKAHYDRHGLDISASELPDYLPLFLEFLSTLPKDEAREMLGQPIEILAALLERLRKRHSIYAGALLTLIAIADKRAKDETVAELLSNPDDDPNDFQALDKAWEEEPVTFGPGAQGCGKVGAMADRIRAQMPSNAQSERN